MTRARTTHDADALGADAPGPEASGPGPALCVLASGSGGNCAVLRTPAPGADGGYDATLIDLGLSPTRTRAELARRGIDPSRVTDVVFTHLDSDHCHPGWIRGVHNSSWRATLHIHERHLGRAERAGLLTTRTRPFGARHAVSESITLGSRLLAHDSLGVACLRLEVDRGDGRRAHIGVATDVGRVTPGLIGHLRGVDCLAIESNYDPVMQRDSGRPEALKRRIMGGSGHLSNELSAHAVERIAPLEHLVLLHLSRQCNSPGRVASAHARHGLAPVITDQFAPTPWIRIEGRERAETSPAPAGVQGELFPAGRAG